MCLIVPLAALAALILSAYALTPLRERLSLRDFAGDDSFLTIAGYRVHYSDDGPRDAPPVVLIHGFGAWSFTWRALRPVLLHTGYRVIATDQLGYGASERPAGPIYTTRLQAEVVLGALNALGVGPADLIGHSFGGRIAMQLAIIAPARVRSIVAIAPEAFATARPPIARLVDVPLLGYALAFYSTAPRLVRLGLKYVAREYSWLTDEAVRGYAAPAYVRGSVAAQIWQARSPKDGAQPVPSHFADIRQRVLLIWGAGDPVFPVADAERLAKLLPDAQLRVIAGAGHLPHEERAPEVEEAVLAFLGMTADR